MKIFFIERITMSGKEFRKWRRLHDITQDRIALNCDTSISTVSKWENDLLVISENTYEKIISFMEHIDINEERK
jgi:transcriptional regulator with XRE-family HTH domain